jgi:hypothetical protein
MLLENGFNNLGSGWFGFDSHTLPPTYCVETLCSSKSVPIGTFVLIEPLVDMHVYRDNHPLRDIWASGCRTILRHLAIFS